MVAVAAEVVGVVAVVAAVAVAIVLLMISATFLQTIRARLGLRCLSGAEKTRSQLLVIAQVTILHIV
jgi:hypothetical protein